MYYPKCKLVLSDSSKFCGSCGSPVEAVAHSPTDSRGSSTDNGIMNWFIKNTFIGTILAIFFGENWIDEKPKLATVIKIFMSLILILIAFGLAVMLIN